MINYYKILGLENGASQEDIQNAYERLSIELNPANNDNLDFFVEEYQKIQEAYTALTGKKPEEKNEIDSKPSQVPDVFEDSDTLVSILKKFKASENAKKLEIINSLEAFKKGNKTYQQALAMLYKKEDIESIKDVEENENSSNLNTAKEVSPLSDKMSQ